MTHRKAEAAGLLAARGGFADPLDLALRDAERIGRPEFSLAARRASAMLIQGSGLSSDDVL
jgi:hypothetical protein